MPMHTMNPTLSSTPLQTPLARRILSRRRPCWIQRRQYAQSRSNHRLEVPKLPRIPLSARLKPLIPTLFWWSILTSLAVHRLNLRHRAEEDDIRSKAQISVLETLITRCTAGESLADDDLRRELEMVGLRERTALTKQDEESLADTADVDWKEALFGKKFRRVKGNEEEEERKAIQEWAQVIREATTATPPPTASQDEPTRYYPPENRTGTARRAPNAQVYI